MAPDDRKAFLEIVVGFAELTGRQLSAPALELYWSAMQEWKLEDFRAAANQLLRTCEFMPKPKDFEDLRKAKRLTTGEAWAKARAIWRAGGAASGDEITDRVVTMLGGYRAMGFTATEQMPFLERRFAAHYAELQEVQDSRRAVPRIAGHSPAERGSARQLGKDC